MEKCQKGNSLAAYSTSRTGLTGGMGRRTVRQRALCLPSQAVYRGKEESKKPNGEGKQVSQRKGRRGTRDAKSRNDPERIERETGEPDDAKVSCPVRGGTRTLIKCLGGGS